MLLEGGREREGGREGSERALLDDRVVREQIYYPINSHCLVQLKQESSVLFLHKELELTITESIDLKNEYQPFVQNILQ